MPFYEFKVFSRHCKIISRKALHEVRLRFLNNKLDSRRFSLVSRACIPEQQRQQRKGLDSLKNGDEKKAGTQSTSKTESQSNSWYCLELVKKYDYENFLCALLLPDVSIRSFVFAVRAFNVEVALIRDQVSQGDIGLGRLAFWRSAIDKVFKDKGLSEQDIPRHPVVQELHQVTRSKSISKKWFVNLVDARERVMNDAAFKTVEELEAYCDKSVSPILYLGLEALGIKNVDTDHAASHLGKAIGLSNFVRSIPHNSQHRRVLLPQELLVKHKLSQESFIRLTSQDKIKDAVFDIASQAHIHYQKATSLKSKIAKEALPLLLAATPTDLYLKKLEKLQFDPYDSRLNRRNNLLPLHLYFRKISRQYF